MKFYRDDFAAGLVVFLVALPLCLGIAIASGAPTFSGIIAGIIGGIVVGAISNAKLSVSGPAAGLTAVVALGITDLNSFPALLLAVFLAGVFQILLSLVKAGIIANYFPSNVVKGMLTAIGILIIMKQIPHAIGLDKDYEGDFSFYQQDGETTLSELMNLGESFNLGALMISFTGLLLLFLWDKTPLKKIKFLPAGLVVVLLGVAINALLSRVAPQWAMLNEHLVNIPILAKGQNPLSLLTFPDFSQILNTKVLGLGFTLGLVASIETLLTIEAIDKLDPQKRYTDPNRELLAQGVGNVFSGLIGGLPITSVIVRGSANINGGAKSQVSTIFHGVLLLVCALLIPGWLNYIPLSALAAILIFTGYKLASPKLFGEMWKNGKSQFIPFIVTVIAILFTDLLKGVGIGMVFSVAFILYRNFHNPFKISKRTDKKRSTIKMELDKEVSFLNRATTLVTLERIAPDNTLVIDARKTRYIDPDVLEVIREFVDVKAPLRNVKVKLVGFRPDTLLTNDKSLLDTIIEELPEEEGQNLQQAIQQKITPQQALALLVEGNQRFVNSLQNNHDYLEQVNVTKDGQYPFAAILSCIDSRTSAELIFNQGLGDIFSIRIAGNILNEDILSSMEFAAAMGTKIIVVLGHTQCGAILKACDNVHNTAALPVVVRKIIPALEQETETLLPNRNGTNEAFVGHVTALNVKLTLQRVRDESAALHQLELEGKIKLIGAVYDIQTGEVDFFPDAETPRTAIHH